MITWTVQCIWQRQVRHECPSNLLPDRVDWKNATIVVEYNNPNVLNRFVQLIDTDNVHLQSSWNHAAGQVWIRGRNGCILEFVAIAKILANRCECKWSELLVQLENVDGVNGHY